MAQNLPQEIVDLIVDFLPKSSKGPWFSPKQDLSVPECTLINRAFSAAARRRRFSTLVVAFCPTEGREAFKARLTTLINLLQPSGGLVGFVQTLSLGMNAPAELLKDHDVLLHQLMTLFDTAASRLFNLTILCGYARPAYTQKFGPLFQQAIQALLPRLQGVALSHLDVPTAFIENLTSLQSLRLRWVNLEDDPATSNTNGAAFPLSISTFYVHGCDYHVHEWYRARGQSAPSFKTVHFEEEFGLSISVLQDILLGSTSTLETLNLYALPEIFIFLG